MRRIALVAAGLAAAVAILPAGTVAATRGAPCGLDRQYLQTSIEGDLFEIAGGRIAQARAASPPVHALAGRLVADHSKSLDEAARLARRLGMAVPGNPDPAMHWQLHVVSGLSGNAFDRAYSWLEVANHVVAVDAAKMEATYGCHPAVRRLARTKLPTLRVHLSMASQAQKAVAPQ